MPHSKTPIVKTLAFRFLTGEHPLHIDEQMRSVCTAHRAQILPRQAGKLLMRHEKDEGVRVLHIVQRSQTEAVFRAESFLIDLGIDGGERQIVLLQDAIYVGGRDEAQGERHALP